MSTQLAKRRRTSPTTVIAVGDGSEPEGRARPSITGRASYLSPTKASLSRSHPEILARSPGRFRNSAQPLSRTPIQEQKGYVEPELPPTPTQLGLVRKPEEPRGLAESSSPDRRGSRRSRTIRSDREISSPLRRATNVLETKSNGGQRENSALSSRGGIIEKESQVAEAATQQLIQDEPAEEILHGCDMRLMVRDDLRAQLKDLQATTAQLEDILAKQDDDPTLDLNGLDLITRASSLAPTPTSSSLPALEDPVALGVNPLVFLRAFAPADLGLNTSTKTSRFCGRLQQSYSINIFAPSPWPAHVFSASFKVTCDVEMRCVVGISDAKIHPQYGPGIKELKSWILSRLKNPLHQLDIGTLVWGLGMWWKESVNRAQYLHFVSTTKAGKIVDSGTPYRAEQPVEGSDVPALLPYIGKSFVELIPAEPYSNKASTNEARKYRQTRLLLKWDLEIDWAGEVHAEIGVAGTMISAKGHESLKQGFEELMVRKGLDPAVNQILALCSGKGVSTRRKIG